MKLWQFLKVFSIGFLIISVIGLAFVSAKIEIAGFDETGRIIDLNKVTTFEDLLTSENSWTGTNEFNGTTIFNDDVTFNEEINGDVVSYLFYYSGNFNFNSATNPTLFLYASDVQIQNNVKGVLLSGTGSIKEYNCQYDVSATGGAGVPILKLRVLFDGAIESNGNMATSIATERETKQTEARDTSTYADAEILGMQITLSSFLGDTTLAMDDITCDVRLYVDD